MAASSAWASPVPDYDVEVASDGLVAFEDRHPLLANTLCVWTAALIGTIAHLMLLLAGEASSSKPIRWPPEGSKDHDPRSSFFICWASWSILVSCLLFYLWCFDLPWHSMMERVNLAMGLLTAALSAIVSSSDWPLLFGVSTKEAWGWHGTEDVKDILTATALCFYCLFAPVRFRWLWTVPVLYCCFVIIFACAHLKSRDVRSLVASMLLLLYCSVPLAAARQREHLEAKTCRSAKHRPTCDQETQADCCEVEWRPVDATTSHSFPSSPAVSYEAASPRDEKMEEKLESKSRHSRRSSGNCLRRGRSHSDRLDPFNGHSMAPGATTLGRNDFDRVRAMEGRRHSSDQYSMPRRQRSKSFSFDRSQPGNPTIKRKLTWDGTVTVVDEDGADGAGHSHWKKDDAVTAENEDRVPHAYGNYLCSATNGSPDEKAPDMFLDDKSPSMSSQRKNSFSRSACPHQTSKSVSSKGSTGSTIQSYQTTPSMAGLDLDKSLLASLQGTEDRLGRYTFTETRLGGHSTVHRVLDENSEVFALKTVWLPGMIWQKDFAVNLRHVDREIRLLRSMTWASSVVVKVYDCWFQNDFRHAAIVMEWLPVTLADVFDDCMRSPDDLDTGDMRRWSSCMALGLAAIHSKDIMHRDIKPQNILLSSDRVQCKLADFGVGRSLVRKLEDNQSECGSVASAYTQACGTPGYMSPEVLDGQVYTVSADVYSLGCVVWDLMIVGWSLDVAANELITGEVTGEAKAAELSRSVCGDASKLEFSQICVDMLATEPTKRPSALALAWRPVLAPYTSALVAESDLGLALGAPPAFGAPKEEEDELFRSLPCSGAKTEEVARVLS